MGLFRTTPKVFKKARRAEPEALKNTLTPVWDNVNPQ